MMGDKIYLDYAGWSDMQRWGRYRVHKASKDPVARTKLLADMLRSRPETFRLPACEMRAALSSLPTYCIPSTAPTDSPLNKAHKFSFLGSFPPEIRNAIYQYVVHYPTCRELFDAYYGQADRLRSRNDNDVSSDFEVRLYTPTVLLLCKQITREALTLLRPCPFVIDRIPPWIMGRTRPLPLTHLIGKGTLQNIHFAEIRLSLGDGEMYLSGQVWLQVLKDILRVWSGKNSLVRLKIMIKVNNILKDRRWVSEINNYAKIINMIESFAFKHGRRPNLLHYEHWVLDRNRHAYGGNARNPQIRKHPDPYIWQGSIMEWI
ncbi:hypothetical protein F4802DRAFT_608975 [Xylaria palmicola]|nr:hypothetical protein F4802DRAFT_608975 [Xylaria palmicola]